MAVKDEWVRAAMNDDNMVVHLLLTLKLKLKQPQAATTLKRGARQPRSRATLTRCDDKRGGDFSTRCSPTTPLSWRSGGATSTSAADGFEATSRPPPSRSKGTAVDETININTKRTRRKKTIAELKEEENLLLKERIYLQKEIASTRTTCNEQRARNEHLKRIKLDLNLHIVKNSSLVADEPKNVLSHHSLPSSDAMDDRRPLVDSHDVDCLVLPDLNMMPCENDSDTETLYETS
ncbi:hypothetical protein GQ457_16G000600 [Hibiscus cannabinus]